MVKKDNSLNDVNQLLERVDILLKKGKLPKKKTCKDCQQIKPIMGKTGRCESCLKIFQRDHETEALNKRWLSPGDGFMKTYVKGPDGKLKVVNLHRHLVELSLGRVLSSGEKVIFKDDNKENCDLSNLALLSNSAIDIICANCGSPLRTPEVPLETPPQTQPPLSFDLSL